mmetsp:Transcript_12468/g.36210  ORF Transcript_12468/g.36210 Transcript_12468/m.36210 type:complete len:1217 (-) Transcript_12468:69-3719(-)
MKLTIRRRVTGWLAATLFCTRFILPTDVAVDFVWLGLSAVLRRWRWWWRRRRHSSSGWTRWRWSMSSWRRRGWRWTTGTHWPSRWASVLLLLRRRWRHSSWCTVRRILRSTRLRRRRCTHWWATTHGWRWHIVRWWWHVMTSWWRRRASSHRWSRWARRWWTAHSLRWASSHHSWRATHVLRWHRSRRCPSSHLLRRWHWLTSGWSTWWCHPAWSRCSSWTTWRRRGTRSRILHELHEIIITEGSTLEGRRVLDEEPEEARFHVPVSFTHDLHLGVDGVGIVDVLSQGMHDCPDTRGEVVTIRLHDDLRCVDTFQRMQAEERTDQAGVGTTSDPHVHVDAVVEQVNSIGCKIVHRQRNDLRQQDVVATSNFVILAHVLDGCSCTLVHRVERKQTRVQEVLGLLHPHRCNLMMRLDTLVGMDVGAATETNVLHHCQRVQGKQLEVGWQRCVFVRTWTTTLGLLLRLLWDRVSRYGALVTALRCADHVGAHLLHANPRIVDAGLDPNVHTLLRQQVASCHGIHACDEFGCQRRHGQRLRHDTDATLSGAAGVQQRSLHRHVVGRHALLVVRQVECEDAFRVHVGQGHQIGSADVEVAVKVGDAHPLRATNSHDGLKGGFLHQRLVELLFETLGIALRIEGDVGKQRSVGQFGKLAERCKVHVLVREEEHVDADLLTAEFDGRVAVPRGGRAQNLDFVGSSHQSRIFSWLQRSVTQIRHDGLEDAHFPAHLLHDGEGCLEGWSQAALRHDRPFHEHFGKRIQKGFHHRSRFSDVDQEVVGKRDEEFLQVADHHHLRLIEIGVQVVVMHGIVEGDEPDLRAIAARQIIQGLLDGVGGTGEHPAADGSRTDVEDEKVRRFLRWAHHVLGGCDEFDGTLAQLRTLEAVTAQPLLVEMAKVGSRRFVHLGANIATPSAALLHPVHECVDVGAASLASNDAGAARLDDGHILIFAVGARGQRTQNSTERKLGRGCQRGGLRDLGGRESAETVWDFDGEINVFLERLRGPLSWCHAGRRACRWSSTLHLSLSWSLLEELSAIGIARCHSRRWWLLLLLLLRLSWRSNMGCSRWWWHCSMMWLRRRRWGATGSSRRRRLKHADPRCSWLWRWWLESLRRAWWLWLLLESHVGHALVDVVHSTRRRRRRETTRSRRRRSEAPTRRRGRCSWAPTSGCWRRWWWYESSSGRTWRRGSESTASGRRRWRRWIEGHISCICAFSDLSERA